MNNALNIFSKRLDCVGCPAKNLLNLDRSKCIEGFRSRALEELGSPPKVLLLCESAPRKRFVYDRSSDYSSGGLRANLRKELTADNSDESLYEYLKQKKVWIIDSALCPLHGLSNRDRRHAATLCLSRHTRACLDRFPSAKVISIYPSKCGILKTQIPDIANRIQEKFSFNRLDGLRSAIEAILRDA